jgi:hypothetical protein
MIHPVRIDTILGTSQRQNVKGAIRFARGGFDHGIGAPGYWLLAIGYWLLALNRCPPMSGLASIESQ